jgi:hypothetical protein
MMFPPRHLFKPAENAAEIFSAKAPRLGEVIKASPPFRPLTKRFRVGRLCSGSSIVRTRGERKMKLGQEKRE